MSLFVALLALSFLIFFHELGHFLIARLLGVKVEVFSIGFGKKIFTKTYKGTEYALSLIPLGGYVKMKGQNDSNPLQKDSASDSYTSKSPLQRIAILLAGPLFNILLAFLIYASLSYGSKPMLLPIVGEVQKESPAYFSGIQKNDLIVKVNQKKVSTWGEMVALILDSKNNITLQIDRRGEIIDLGIIPKMIETKNVFGETKQTPLLGIKALGSFGRIHYGVWDAIVLGIQQTAFHSVLIFEGVKRLVLGSVPTSDVGGVISIVQVMDKAQESGLIQFLALVALISINLGILNLLPIPALDGGHIIFNLYEIVMRKSPSENAMYYLTLLGWAILLSLMILGFYNDVNRIFKG